MSSPDSKPSHQRLREISHLLAADHDPEELLEGLPGICAELEELSDEWARKNEGLRSEKETAGLLGVPLSTLRQLRSDRDLLRRGCVHLMGRRWLWDIPKTKEFFAERAERAKGKAWTWAT